MTQVIKRMSVGGALGELVVKDLVDLRQLFQALREREALKTPKEEALIDALDKFFEEKIKDETTVGRISA